MNSQKVILRLVWCLLPLVLFAQIENWVYRYDGPANGLDHAWTIVYGSDGNIYAAGNSRDIDASLDFLVIGLTDTGTKRWVYRYNGSGYNDAGLAWSIVYGSDGNIYIAGLLSIESSTYYDDFTIISLTSAGIERWVYTYNGSGNYNDGANSIVYGSDGNMYAAGYSYGSGTGSDFTIISLTPAGTGRWIYTYNPPGSDGANSIIYGSDGNIYAAGYSYGSGTGSDFLVISLTSAGTEKWVYTYNGPESDNDGANSIIYGSDGNIYAAGYSIGSGTGSDFTVISVDTAGTERWVYRYNGSGNGSDCANGIIYNSDGNIYAAGYSVGSGTGSDFTVISVDTAGTEKWVYRYNGSGSDDDRANSIVCGSDGNIYAAGWSTGSGTDCDFAVISLEPEGKIDESQIRNSKSQIPSLKAYPNPFREKTDIRFQPAPPGGARPGMTDKQLSDISHQSSVSIKVYDATGRLVKNFSRLTHDSATHYGGLRSTLITWDGTNDRGNCLPQGIYFLGLETPNYYLMRKVCKLK
jgi:uncharacterized delta-60 repeat protein